MYVQKNKNKPTNYILNEIILQAIVVPLASCNEHLSVQNINKHKTSQHQQTGNFSFSIFIGSTFLMQLTAAYLSRSSPISLRIFLRLLTIPVQGPHHC